jgi:hypothetical protein
MSTKPTTRSWDAQNRFDNNRDIFIEVKKTLLRSQYDHLLNTHPEWMRTGYHQMQHVWSLGCLTLIGTQEQIDEVNRLLTVFRIIHPKTGKQVMVTIPED